VDSTMMTSNIK